MGAGAGTCQRGAGCAGCAERDAAIARIEADRDAAERRAAEALCAVAFEREGREDAESRLQAATDRIEFVEPMYATVRSRYEELRGQYADLRAECRDLEDEKASLGESLALAKREAARAVALEARNGVLEEYAAKMRLELKGVLAELQGHVKGRVVYPQGPNTPPSEAGGRRQGRDGGDARQDGQGAPGRRGGRRKPRRKIPGRPGGRKGHRGHGISYDPNAKTVVHKFRRKADGSLDLPACPCGRGCWSLTDNIARIIRDIEFVLRDTKHDSERASCTGCGAEAWASDGEVPRDGAYGANLVALVVLLRDNNVKYYIIASILAEMVGRAVMSKASAIKIYGRTSDMHREESEEIMGKIEGSPVGGGDETLGPSTRIRLTARVSELVWLSEYIRGALPAIAGGCARAALSEALLEEPALPAPPPALPAPAAGGAAGGGGGCDDPGPCGAVSPAAQQQSRQPPALPAPAARQPQLQPACPAGAEAALASAAMDWILSAAAESAAALRESGGDDAEDAADAAVGIALDSIGEAFLNATVGTEVGARAEEAGQDGSFNGIAWLWVFHNTRQTAYRSALTRSADVVEKYMGRFAGIFVADRYAAYPKALGDCEIQWCWAHELRHARTDALLPEATDEAAELGDEIGSMFKMAKDLLELNDGRRSHALRVIMESELGDVLDRHAGSDDPVVIGMVKRVRRGLPHLFVFLEYDGVEPTNNRSENPLRRPVTFRKSSHQCKGGRKSMERTDHMSTCTRSWRDEGKSVFGEIRRTVLEHGTPWRRRRGRPGRPPPPPSPTGPGPPAAHAAADG